MLQRCSAAAVLARRARACVPGNRTGCAGKQLRMHLAPQGIVDLGNMWELARPVFALPSHLVALELWQPGEPRGGALPHMPTRQARWLAVQAAWVP